MSQVFVSGRPRQSKEVFFTRPPASPAQGRSRDDTAVPAPKRTASTSVVKQERPQPRRRTYSDDRVVASKSSPQATARRKEVRYADEEEEEEQAPEQGFDVKSIIGGIAGLGAVAASAAFAPGLLPLASTAARAWIGDGGANAVGRLAGAGIDAIAGKQDDGKKAITDDSRFSVVEDRVHAPSRKGSTSGKQLVKARK